MQNTRFINRIKDKSAFAKMDNDNEMEVMETVDNADEEMENDSDESVSSDEESDDEGDETTKQDVYLPGKPLETGEELVCDESAYTMLHQARTGAPCLSFDIIQDNLGSVRETFPMTSYIVAGTQAAKAHVNK